MYAAVMVLSVSLVSAPDASRATGEQTESPVTLREWERITTQALRAEKTATTANTRRKTILELVELAETLKRDRRLPTSATLQRLGAKIRSRLRAVQSNLKRQASHERKSVPIVESSGRRQGARGGRAQRADHADELIELIQATISPNTWDVNGGPSSIYYFAPRHALVVRAPGEVHSSVRQTLVDLRQAGP